MKRAVLLLAILVTLAVTAGAQLKRDRFQTNLIEPDGFLGLRLGFSIQVAEDILGEATLVRSGSKEWHFTSADYDPYEALTVLADRGSINGFIAHLRANRIQFKDMNLIPAPSRLGTFFATRKYTASGYEVNILCVGEDSSYIRRITMQAKRVK